MNKRPVLTFAAVCYGLSIAIGLAVGLTGGHGSRLIGLGYASMFVPAIAVVVVRAASREGPRIDWSRFPIRYIPVALLLIPGVLHAVMLPVTAALEGSLPWQGWLTPRQDGLYHAPVQFGWGALSVGGLAGRITIHALAGMIVVSMLALFEEIGWRGWLLPRLSEAMGARRAILVSSLMWGAWHLPYVLGGIYFDWQATRHAMLMAVSLPIGSLAFGLVIGWLWVRTESIWIVALAHGALNNWGQYAFKYMKDFSVASDAVVLDTGIFAVLVVGAVLVWRSAGY